MKITIDPGHGINYNTGVVKGYYESNTVFKLAGYLKAELEAYGFEVAVTKPVLSCDPSLEARGKLAITNGSDIFISLHSNAASASAQGVLAIISLKRPGSEALAKELVHEVAYAMGTSERPVWTRVYPNTANTDYYGVLRAATRTSEVPYAFILEHGFHTNLKECTTLSNDSNLHKIAATEAKVFSEHFGINKKQVSDTTQDIKLKRGDSYQFKVTSTATPKVNLGGSGVAVVLPRSVSGNDYFYYIVGVGNAGDAVGLYVNDIKTFVAHIV